MNEEPKSLAELRALDIPVATCERLGIQFRRKYPGHRRWSSFDNGVDVPVLIQQADKYLKHFCAEPICPACDRKLGGIFGTFRWGMATGEGSCSACGYPCRAIHDIKAVGILTNMALAYHPSLQILEES